MMDSSRIGNDAGWMRYIWLLWMVWLAFLVYPVTALFQAHPGPLRLVIVLIAAGAFAALYSWNVWNNLRCIVMGRPVSPPWLILATLAVLALLLNLADRHEWIELFIFLGASMAPSLPPKQAAAGVALVALALLAIGALSGASALQTVQIALQSLVSGLAVIMVVRTVVLYRELQSARREIARLAVNEERLRFARDLHDLLGHSLSLIALKSELASRLATRDPERAAGEMRDVEAAARSALREVREAVAGYRQPDLAGELVNAQEVLSAAGIGCEVQEEIGRVPVPCDAALAWAVREGVVNVVKHSRATRCAIRLWRKGNSLRLEIRDNGVGVLPGESGSGLAGLAERMGALGGSCEAGSGPDGGFCLSVTLPLAAEKARSMVRPA